MLHSSHTAHPAFLQHIDEEAGVQTAAEELIEKQ